MYSSQYCPGMVPWDLGILTRGMQGAVCMCSSQYCSRIVRVSQDLRILDKGVRCACARHSTVPGWSEYFGTYARV